MREEARTEILADLVLAGVCLAISIPAWARLLPLVTSIVKLVTMLGIHLPDLPIPANPYVQAACLVGVLNACHLCLGMFRISRDPADLAVAPGDRMMQTPVDLAGALAWILLTLTIGPSRYLVDAVRTWRAGRPVS